MFAQFQLYSSSHLWAVGACYLLGAVLVYLCRLGFQHKICTYLGIACLLSFPVQLGAYLGSEGHFRLENYVPLHLCDIAAIITGLALLKRQQRVMEIAYFWGLSGTIQGLITPDLHYDFPHPIYLAFFWLHGFVVLGALLFPLGLGWRPRRKAAWSAFLWLQLYVAIAFLANATLDTNFAFLSEKPLQGSLLDHLGPAPWYYLSLEIIALTLFLLLALPYKTYAKQNKRTTDSL